MSIEEKPYAELVEEEAQKYYLPAHRTVRDAEGKTTNILPPDYHQEDDADRLKYHYFFESVNYDREICESVLHPLAVSIRQEIMNCNLATLMIEAQKAKYRVK